MGIIGFGNIGRKVAAVSKALGMKVIINTRTIPDTKDYEFVSKEEIFAMSDVISINCPLTPQTEKLVNKNTLSLMKKTWRSSN